jgi:hypothetical protein
MRNDFIYLQVMQKYKVYISVALLLVLFAICSCEKDENCNFSTVAGVNYTLTKTADSKVTNFFIAPSANLSDTLFASGSFGYVLTLPLSVAQNSTAFAFVANDSTTDEIVFYHSMKLSFLDEACGFVPEFKLDSFKYTTLEIDTIQWLINDVTTDIENANIKIFY